MSYTKQHIAETIQILQQINATHIDQMVSLILKIKQSRGRVFFLGVGGSAANCSHAVNDFRKILNIEAYAPTDNVAELSARTNDEGWASVFVNWLKTSKLNQQDLVFVLSVGGGDLKNNISPNIVLALQYAHSVGANITGIVGRQGGYTACVAQACVIIPTINTEHITVHTEALQSVICHLLVSHPMLKTQSSDEMLCAP